MIIRLLYILFISLTMFASFDLPVAERASYFDNMFVVSEEIFEFNLSDVAKNEVDIPTTEKMENIIKTETKKLSVQEIAAAVIRGEYGDGSARIANIEAMGYNYSEIQEIVNQMTRVEIIIAKEPVTEIIEYKAGRVYIKNSEMPFIFSDFKNQQSVINANPNTWVTAGTYPNWSPSDIKGTFFAQHNFAGGDIIMKLSLNDVIVITDSNNVPYKYVVDTIIRNELSRKFTEELAGELDKEYIIFQTCEYGKGNIHVFATIQ